MNIKAFVDVFDISEFDLHPDGFHRIKHTNMVFQKLRDICEAESLSYEWQIADFKVHPSTGRLMVNGSLKVFEQGNPYVSITVPGLATGQTPENDLAGIGTSALINACLRGLGMAEFVYAMAPQPAQQQQQPAPPQQHYAPPPQQYTPPPNNGGGYQARQRPGGPPAGNGGGYRPGNGFVRGGNGGSGGPPRVGGQGIHAGKLYTELPIEVLQQWANFDQPNPKAIAELNRRMSATAGGPPATQYGGNNGPAEYEDEIPF